tara:strand:+ start:321 stop:596 length:276 start_codon:yes stop_codon:yes gene_type:complete
MSFFFAGCGTPIGKITEGAKLVLSASKLIGLGNEIGIKKGKRVFVSYSNNGVEGELQGTLFRVKNKVIIIKNDYGSKVSIPKDNISYISEW